MLEKSWSLISCTESIITVTGTKRDNGTESLDQSCLQHPWRKYCISHAYEFHQCRVHPDYTTIILSSLSHCMLPKQMRISVVIFFIYSFRNIFDKGITKIWNDDWWQKFYETPDLKYLAADNFWDHTRHRCAPQSQTNVFMLRPGSLSFKDLVSLQSSLFKRT